MDTNFSIKKSEAIELRKNGDFKKAVILYQNIWENHHSLCNEWDGWGYAKCLKEIGETDKALIVCRQYYPLKKGFDVGNNLYAWCIYEIIIKTTPDEIKKNEDEFFKGADAIVKLVSQEIKTPYSKTILKVCDYLIKSSARFPVAKIFKWIKLLKGEELSCESYSFTDKKNKIREIASEKERFYVLKSKTLEKLSLYQECIDLCRLSLKEIEKFHYNNDIWLKRRHAICLGKQGHYENSLNILISILKKKDDWFIYFDISKLYCQMDDCKNALTFAIKAALCRGKNEYKWKLFFHMAIIYKNLDNIDLAIKHSVFAYKLHEGNDWSIPEDLNQLIESLGENLTDHINPSNLKSTLIKIWKKELIQHSDFLHGTIKHILPNGYAGFITTTKKDMDYYFNFRDARINKKFIKTGLQVLFLIKDSFDKKKQVASKVAYDIQKYK